MLAALHVRGTAFLWHQVSVPYPPRLPLLHCMPLPLAINYTASNARWERNALATMD